MTCKDLAKAGYRKYTNNILNHCDWYWAKMMTDDIGKRYQIIVSAYDWSKTPFPGRNGISYQPQVQYGTHGEDRTCNVTKLGVDTVEEMEEFFERLFEYLGRPYYERWKAQ